MLGTRRADRRREAEFSDFAGAAQQRLYRQAYLLAGEREAARDLVQTTLMKLYVAWPRVDHPAAYAQRTMVRSFLTSRQRENRERALHRLADAPAGVGDPDASVSVLAALARLAPRMRAVIVLRYWEDLSVEQAAVALGCSTGTVKSASSKGLAHLRDLLGESFEERVPADAVPARGKAPGRAPSPTAVPLPTTDERPTS